MTGAASRDGGYPRGNEKSAVGPERVMGPSRSGGAPQWCRSASGGTCRLLL